VEIQIYVGYLEKCSTARTRIIAFRLGGHTLIWTTPMSWMAHEGWFICSRYHKRPNWVVHNYDWHKQLIFHSLCSSLFPHMSNYLLLVINNFLLARSIEMDHLKPSLVRDFFCIQLIKMILLINSRRPFLMPNRKNAKIKSRRLGIASCRRHFSNKCIKYNFYIFFKELHFLEQFHLIMNHNFFAKGSSNGCQCCMLFELCKCSKSYSLWPKDVGFNH
jgi:hypothetical protein